MAVIVADNLWVCVDCAGIIANGESDEYLESQLEDITIGLDRIEGHWVLDYDGDLDTGYDVFSKQKCDGCGSRYGGSRFRAAVLS